MRKIANIGALALSLSFLADCAANDSIIGEISLYGEMLPIRVNDSPLTLRFLEGYRLNITYVDIDQNGEMDPTDEVLEFLVYNDINENEMYDGKPEFVGEYADIDPDGHLRVEVITDILY